jgi:hypothetical protein
MAARASGRCSHCTHSLGTKRDSGRDGGGGAGRGGGGGAGCFLFTPPRTRRDRGVEHYVLRLGLPSTHMP